MIDTTMVRPMRLLDVREAHRDRDFVDRGEVWSVMAGTAEWSAGAEPGGRRPVVTVREDRDGRRIVLELDEEGRPVELAGVFVEEG